MTRERDRIQENANKYIVKNCPAVQQGTCEKYGMCQDCTDCVIKQVIEKCKGEHKKEIDYMFWVDKFAQEILQLFDL